MSSYNYNPNRSLVLFFSSECLLSFGVGMSQYALPLYYAQNHLTDATIGLLFAANSLAAGLVALMMGTIANRAGASRLFKIATALLPLGYLITGLSALHWLWFVSAALTGLGGAMLMSTENVVLSSLIHSGVERARVFSRFVAMYMSVMGAGAVCGGFVSNAVGYHDTLVAGSALALVAPIVRGFVRAPDTRASRMHIRVTPLILWMSVFTAIFGVANGMITPFLTLLLQGTFGMRDRPTAAVFAVSMFMVAAGSWLVAPMLRKFGRLGTLLASFAGGTALTAGMIAPHTALPFVILYLLRSAVTSIPGPIVDATFLGLLHESSYVQMFGIRVLGLNAGTAIGQFSGGTLLSHGSLRSLLLVSAALLGLSFVYLHILLRRVRAAHEEDYA